MRRLGLALGFLLVTAAAAHAQVPLVPTPPCAAGPAQGTYYVAVNGTAATWAGGSATGATTSPIRLRDFWTVTGGAAGKVACLFDGTYTGLDLLRPPTGLSGTQANRITARAVNDGGVTFDGDFTTIPIRLSGNNWFIIEGFNAIRGNPNVMRWENQSNFNIGRRLVLRDTIIHTNTSIWTQTGSLGPNYLEDFAMFGTGRSTGFGAGQGSQSNPGQGLQMNRVWIRWEGTTVQGPKLATFQYNSREFKADNVLLTITGESMPERYKITGTGGGGAETGLQMTAFESYIPLGFLINDKNETFPCANARLTGVLFYMKAAHRFNWPDSFATVRTSGAVDCVLIDNFFGFVHPQSPRFSLYRGYSMSSSVTSPQSLVMRNSTTVAGNSNVNTGKWTIQNHAHGLSLAAVPSPFTNPGPNGANLCFEYENGVRTNRPLWPWPMNDRIKRATANAGSYLGNGGPGCTPDLADCQGTPPAVRTETDVTADIEATFGAIPAECRRDGGGTTPPPVTTPKVQYFIDEAASGTTPTHVLDSGDGAALDLEILYATP